MRKLVWILFFIVVLGTNAQEVKIGILADKGSKQSEQLLQQLKKQILAVVGDRANVSFNDVLENNYSSSQALNNYNKLLSDDTDIILSFGVINTIRLSNRKEYPKPLLVFGTINSDFLSLKSEQESSGIDNFNYIITSQSYTKDLDEFYRLSPYKKIAIIVDDFFRKGIPIESVMKNYFANRPSSFKLMNLKQDGTLDGDLSDVDAVYLAGGFNLNDTNFGKLVSEINNKGIPSFSGVSRRDVERGILFSNLPKTNIDQFFRRIALNIEAIISGKNPSELPIALDVKTKLSLNFNTANRIKFPLKYSMLADFDFLGEMSNQLAEYEYDLRDVMKGVLGENLALKADKKNIDLSEQDVKTSKSNFYPTLSGNLTATYIDPNLAAVGIGTNPEFSTAGNVTLQQTLYSEAAGANITIQKNLLEAQKQNFNSTQLDALLNVSVAYFNALILKTNTQIQYQNLEITKTNLEIAEQNFEAGETGKGDVLRFRSQFAQNIQNLVVASNQLRQSYNEINQLLNDDISKNISIKDAFISKGVFKDYNYDDFKEILDNPKLRPSVVKFLVEEAKRNSPELKSLDFNFKANDRTLKLNSSGRFVPTVALQGQYNMLLSRSGVGSVPPAGFNLPPDNNYNLGLSLSLPIFQQNQRNINVQTAKITADQIQLQRENFELTLERSINDIVLEVINQISNIELSRVAENAAKESLDLIQNEYREGAVPVIQLIDAQNNYLRAQLASANANYNYLLTSIQLERIIGFFFLMNTEQQNKEFNERASQAVLKK